MQGEQISGWILRIAPLVTKHGVSESDTVSAYLRMTKYTLPKVGETLDQWFDRVEVEMTKSSEQVKEQVERVVLMHAESIADCLTRAC